MAKTLLKISVTLFIIFVQASCAILPIRDNPGSQTEAKTANSTLKLKELMPGLESGRLSILEESSGKEYTLSIIRIDPEKFSFRIVENGEKAKTIKEIHAENNAALTLNGSYFDENFQPLGLLVSKGKILNGYSKSALMDGILVLDAGNRPSIVPGRKIDPAEYPFAIQSGPILIDAQGKVKIDKDSGKLASRTIAAVSGENKDSANKIIFIFIKQSLFNSENTISLYRLAHLLKENGELQKIGLHSAINLDGGTSTGFMLMDDYYAEFEKVQNIITVSAKNNGQ